MLHHLFRVAPLRPRRLDARVRGCCQPV